MEHRHGAACPPIIVNLVPADRSGVYLFAEMRGFDGDVAVGLYEALQRTLRRRLWIGRPQLDGDRGTGAGDGHRAAGCVARHTARSLAPIHAHPEALFL